MGVCCNSAIAEQHVTEIKPEALKMIGEGDDESFRAEVDQIWVDYDVSNTGRLNKNEAYNFLRDTMRRDTGLTISGRKAF